MLDPTRQLCPRRFGRLARRGTASLIMLAMAGCGSDSTASGGTGDIHVRAETSGFNKDDAYVVLVDGAGRYPIGANGDVTVSDVEPDIHLVDLVDVASNCEDAPTLARVSADQTAEVLLPVVCAFGEPEEYTMAFEDEELNLDSGEITSCPLGRCSSTVGPDFYVVYNGLRTIHAVIFQNGSNGGVEIAHLPGITLDELTEQDLLGATFTTDIVGDSFDEGRTILIRTDLGAVYALGNPVEDDQNLTLTFDAVLLTEP